MPLDIYQKEFRRVLRGVDPDEVEDFLGRVADDYEQLIKENEALKEQIKSLEAGLDTPGATGAKAVVPPTSGDRIEKAESSKFADREMASNIIREGDRRTSMLNLKDQINSAVEYIRRQTDIAPEVAVVLGTGLGALAHQVKDALTVPYEKIPHFPVSTLEAHAGNLVFGTIEGKKVATMQGRCHYYEGYSMKEVTFPVRVMKALGARVLIVSNAAGSMNDYIEPGDIMVITDHINMMSDNPLRGHNNDSLGPRYPDMYNAYSPDLIDLVCRVAMEEKIIVHRGVFVAVDGPNLETPAEYRFLRLAGADAVSMSTVPEVIVAVHSSMKVLGLCCITDKCTPDALGPADIKEIIRVANNTEPKLTKLVTKVISRM